MMYRIKLNNLLSIVWILSSLNNLHPRASDKSFVKLKKMENKRMRKKMKEDSCDYINQFNCCLKTHVSTDIFLVLPLKRRFHYL